MVSDLALSPLVRAALFVRDLDRSVAFYRMLGFTDVYYEGVLDQASTAAVLHVPASTNCRCCILKHAGLANYGMVGLFELTSPVPPPVTRPRGEPCLGEVTLVFYCADLERVRREAPALGALDVWEPTPFVSARQTSFEMCLRDPDGVLINLIGREPDEAFRTTPLI